MPQASTLARPPRALKPAPGAHEGVRSLDIQHLTTLSLLLQECGVTQVAALTGKAQPAVSRTLARLREVFNDPLLVRSGARLVLTDRALGLRESLDAILHQIARMEAGTTFCPRSSAREFRLAVADCLPAAFFPGLISRLTGAGRKISVKLRSIDPAFDVAHALQDGSIDLVVNNNPNPREDLRIGPLFTDEVVCILRASHPLAGLARISLARYLGLQHLAPHPSSLTDLGPVDGELAKVGYRRQIVATVPEFNLVPEVLLQTDLVFTTGQRFAAHCASRLPLVVVAAPVEFPPMKFYQLWHERNQTSAANRWLREQVAAVAGTLQPGPALQTT
jgi:DNA-binding transcriptional LysR family regulator